MLNSSDDAMEVDVAVTAAQKRAATRARNRALQEAEERDIVERTGENKVPTLCHAHR